MICVISDTHIPERMAKLSPKFLNKIKPNDIIFSYGSKIGHKDIWGGIFEMK